MNILVVVGSGTRNGATSQLANSFIKGATESGHQVEKIFLGNKQVAGCLGCDACQRIIDSNCVIKDDMQNFYEPFARADVLVLASPLYFWTISARIKAFIERLYGISKDDIYPIKKTMLLMTGGDNHFWTFDQAVNYYRFFTRAINWIDCGIYLAGGTKYDGTKHIVKKRHMNGVYQYGKEIFS